VEIRWEEKGRKDYFEVVKAEKSTDPQNLQLTSLLKQDKKPTTASGLYVLDIQIWLMNELNNKINKWNDKSTSVLEAEGLILCPNKRQLIQLQLPNLEEMGNLKIRKHVDMQKPKMKPV
jgi:hypothetical protein